MSGRSNEDLAKFLGDMACDFGMACLMGISGGVAGIGGLGMAADAAFAASSLAASSVAGWPSVAIASCTAVTGIGVAAFGAVMIYVSHRWLPKVGSSREPTTRRHATKYSAGRSRD